MSKYDDIINLPHHVSRSRTPMTMANRAAQFAPFAALSGHEEAISETRRLTSSKLDLSVDTLDKLSRRLMYAIETQAYIAIRYFQPDMHKHGGCYKEITGKIKRIDEMESLVVLTDGSSIPLDSVMGIEGEIFNDLEL